MLLRYLNELLHLILVKKSKMEKLQENVFPKTAAMNLQTLLLLSCIPSLHLSMHLPHTVCWKIWYYIITVEYDEKYGSMWSLKWNNSEKITKLHHNKHVASFQQCTAVPRWTNILHLWMVFLNTAFFVFAMLLSKKFLMEFIVLCLILNMKETTIICWLSFTVSCFIYNIVLLF